MNIMAPVNSMRILRQQIIAATILIVGLISSSSSTELERDGNNMGVGGAQPSAVKVMVDELVEAWEQEDLDAAVDMFSADAVLYDPAWPPGKFEGPEEIRNWTAGHFESFDEIDLILSERTVRSIGRVAWFQAEYVLAVRSAEPDAEPTRGEGFLSILWVKLEDGTYKSPLFHAIARPSSSGGEAR